MEQTIFLLSSVAPGKVCKPPCSDTVAAARSHFGPRERGIAVLLQAQRCYAAMDDFRRKRERCKRYTYGDQWGDPVVVDGVQMTEEQYLLKQGRVPLKNNLIRRLVRNVVGVFRAQASEPTCTARDRDEQRVGETMSTLLQCNRQANRAADMEARGMEEFLISGMVVQRKFFGWRDGRDDCWTDPVQPGNFFVDAHMRDFRGRDCTLVGEVHDISFQELCSSFAKSPEDFERLGQMYSSARDPQRLAGTWDSFGLGREDRCWDFLYPKDTSLCRVIEVWRHETKPRYRCHDYNTGRVFKAEIEDKPLLVDAANTARLAQAVEAGIAPEEVPMIEAEWFIDNFWYYYFLTPEGDILSEGETPYAHGSHPYVFKAYPFIDGEIHSFVADIIDQQRYANRLIMMQDMIMQSSAKGVLLVPDSCIPDGMTPADFAEKWVEFNGVIVYHASNTNGHMPTQVAANSTNIGIHELLQLQMRFFEEITGVSGALQGKPGFAGMSAALYAQQTHNATNAILDILETYASFIQDGAYKDVKNIQQYYTPERVLSIAGKSSLLKPSDPDVVRDAEFDLSVVQSTATPAYRAITNDMLMQLLQGGQISLEQVLEVGDFPFADALLQSVKAKKEELEQQQGQQQALMAQLQAQQGDKVEAAQAPEGVPQGMNG